MKKPITKILFFVIFAVLLGVFVYSGIQLWSYYSAADAADDAYQSLQQIKDHHVVEKDPAAPTQNLSTFETMTPQELEQAEEMPYTGILDTETGETTYLLPEYEELYKMNRDLVGWITIPGTRVDYPVVHRPEDVDYYLYRDFQRKESAWGCIYVREPCDVFKPSDNVVIYGHRMLDGSMFADLANYEDYEFWKEHQFIQFDTLRGRHKYQIVCVMRISNGTSYSYPYHRFIDAADELEFYAFWAKCKERAIYDTGLDVTYGDKLISLFTCEYTQINGRLVVVAKRISE